MKQKEIV